MSSVKKLIALSLVVLSVIVLLFVVDAPLICEVYDKQDYIYTSVGIGWSMEPYIENGDTIIVLTEDYPGFSAVVGDVLVYRYTDDMNVAHRIYNIQNGRYYVKGDNNDNVDYLFVREESVVGKVIGVVDNRNVIARYIVNQIV